MSIEIRIRGSYNDALRPTDRGNWHHRIVLHTNDSEPYVCTRSVYGNGVSFDVWHGRTQVLGCIPDGVADTTDIVSYLESNDAQEALAAVVAGYGEHWDGNNMVGSLTDDACDAIDDIRRSLEDVGQWLPFADDEATGEE